MLVKVRGKCIYSLQNYVQNKYEEKWLVMDGGHRDEISRGCLRHFFINGAAV